MTTRGWSFSGCVRTRQPPERRRALGVNVAPGFSPASVFFPLFKGSELQCLGENSKVWRLPRLVRACPTFVANREAGHSDRSGGRPLFFALLLQGGRHEVEESLFVFGVRTFQEAGALASPLKRTQSPDAGLKPGATFTPKASQRSDGPVVLTDLLQLRHESGKR